MTVKTPASKSFARKALAAILLPALLIVLFLYNKFAGIGWSFNELHAGVRVISVVVLILISMAAFRVVILFDLDDSDAFRLSVYKVIDETVNIEAKREAMAYIDKVVAMRGRELFNQFDFNRIKGIVSAAESKKKYTETRSRVLENVK